MAPIGHTLDERALLGQVFTPPAVADLTLRLALATAPSGARVLDPACGDGVFLARARVLRPDVRVRGVDIDPTVIAAARRYGEVTLGDFLDEEPPATGLDAVVGNPPYVRQERLGAPAKARVAARLATDFPDEDPAVIASLAGRADLALAFVARALRFTRPGGRVAFVVSQALLEAGYADGLRELLRGRARLVALVASPQERWFSDAAIHGVIVVLERLDGEPVASARACFARLRVPVAEAARRVGDVADLAQVADVRMLSVEESLAAEGPRWAPLLRAPSAWFDFVSEAAGRGAALVPLGELAEVRRGVTSGANSFFYRERAEAARSGVEAEHWVPLLRTPRHAAAIRVDAAALPVVAFRCDLDGAALDAQPGAAAYVRAHAALAERPSLATRPRWWSLPTRPARLFLTKAYDARFVQHVSPVPLVADQRLYTVEPRPGVDEELLGAVLNGLGSALALESLGRASLGEGVLEWSVGDAATLPVVDPRRLSAAATRRVRAAFAALAARPSGPVDEEVARADRRALDEALLADTPSLTALLPQLRDALVGTVAERRRRGATLASR